MVVRSLGDGVIVALGGPGPLLNENLAAADNAVLAVSVLAPQPGTRVSFLEPRLAVVAGENLEDLVGDPVWLLLIQLGGRFRGDRPVAGSTPRPPGAGTGPRRDRRIRARRGTWATLGRAPQPRSRRQPSSAADAHRTLARALGLGTGHRHRRARRPGRRTDRRSPSPRSGICSADPVSTDADLLVVAAGLADLTGLVDPSHAVAGRSDPTAHPDPGTSRADIVRRSRRPTVAAATDPRSQP